MKLALRLRISFALKCELDLRVRRSQKTWIPYKLCIFAVYALTSLYLSWKSISHLRELTFSYYRLYNHNSCANLYNLGSQISSGC
ncbi:hypothetical protein MPTK1_8g04320 [Marchantia polymorpha subsp. ruderalis]|uniref:Uncharacterized protein n=1 Tax=Marchantia polymorpha TaxID=3197 RepID=A0A2R6W0M7_MARPO|nr:hypothetical protein MARPO_0200s0009 [Marchantia polymorpha]BBN18656.1 hypothetical protein Mp_8g04320 [Marchantia polymorpha subsp. ruderalis]|eukprot:PTQ27409.1 hypothetical protein MARPO_0200s0009 [Marchantia polymorpha]